MRLAGHVRLFVFATLAWLGFWVVGLPDYYQQYPAEGMGIASVLLSALISLGCLALLLPVRPERRMRHAVWLALYFTVPLALYDTLYCGVYLGHGASYLWSYWYLTAFYVSPWLTLPPTALLLRRVELRQAAAARPDAG
jgi:hypothetical protein